MCGRNRGGAVGVAPCKCDSDVHACTVCWGFACGGRKGDVFQFGRYAFDGICGGVCCAPVCSKCGGPPVLSGVHARKAQAKRAGL